MSAGCPVLRRVVIGGTMVVTALLSFCLGFASVRSERIQNEASPSCSTGDSLNWESPIAGTSVGTTLALTAWNPFLAEGEVLYSYTVVAATGYTLVEPSEPQVLAIPSETGIDVDFELPASEEEGYILLRVTAVGVATEVATEDVEPQSFTIEVPLYGGNGAYEVAVYEEWVATQMVGSVASE